jgi:hypothetical protein
MKAIICGALLALTISRRVGRIAQVYPRSHSNWNKYDNKQNLWGMFAMLQAAPRRRIG